MVLMDITTPTSTAKPMNIPRSFAVTRHQMLEQMEPNASYAGSILSNQGRTKMFTRT